MYVRPVRRICDVRGCKNKECFSISRVKEAGNTPVLCRSCLGSALSALDEPEVLNAKVKKPIPSLFFNDEAMGKDALTEEVSVVPDENMEDLDASSQKSAEQVVIDGDAEIQVVSEENSEADTESADTPEGKNADGSDEDGKDALTEEVKPKPKRRGAIKKGEK